MFAAFFNLFKTRNLLFLAACILLLSCASAQPSIGLQLYTFRNQLPKDVPGMLQKISGMGIRDLEGGSTYGLSNEAYKSLLEKNNFRMVSWGASFEDLQNDPQAVADRAAFFGAKFVMCAWVPHNGTVFTIDDAKKAAEVFNNAGRVMKAKGIRFMYHAHGYEFQPYGNGTFFDFLLENMDPALANFEMDVFWFQQAGQDPAAWLLKHPERFLALHLKDRKRGTPNNLTATADVETNVVLGTGDVDIAGIMKAARKAGINYVFLEDESSRSETQVPQSLAYLKTLK